MEDWKPWDYVEWNDVRVVRDELGVAEVYDDGQRCHWDKDGIGCDRRAGAGTTHVGVGLCRAHGGNTKAGARWGAKAMGHALARHAEVTPWEALLTEVKRCAGAVAWLDRKVAEAPDDQSLLSSEEGGYAPWVKMRDKEQDKLRKAAKMALDAGIAVQYIRAMEAEAQTTARVLVNTIDTLAAEGFLTGDAMTRARAILRQELLAIEGRSD